MQSKLRNTRLAPLAALAFLASCGDYSLPDAGGPDLSVPQCGLGASMCGGECVDTNTDKRHCGACDKPCAPGFACIAGACKLNCDVGLSACVMQGICTDLQTDPHNCGTCGTVCLDTEVCASGRCTAACPTDTTNCNRSCVDLNSDRSHCGACGMTCPPGNACIKGSCTLGCPMDLTNCRGQCTDTAGDSQNCGGCGNVCQMGQSCSNSQCAPHCTQGTTDCNGFCANLSNDIRHCGACNIACANGEVCSNGRCAGMCDPGLTTCGLKCANLLNDNANCGKCGNICALGTVCSKGVCEKMCGQGETDCNGVCADISSDNGNCGACGMACPPGNFCDLGKCVNMCTPPRTACGQSCRNFTNDVLNCGKCGVPCMPVTHGTPACVNSLCTVGMCDMGYADCDKQYANGCEVNLTTDAKNCGACGGACQPVANAALKCAAGMCAIDTCNNGYADCNGKLGDGCEIDTKNDPSNCSVCGMACPAPKFATAGCKNGVCGVGTCTVGYDDCNGQSVDGCEVDTQNDPKNCGACARGCGPYPHGVPGCAKGACTVKCEAGWADCNNNLMDGCETDLSSVKSCGACGMMCPSPQNGAPGCQNGVCGVGLCVGGFADCDTVAANGCEINTGTDKLNCGKCGNQCATPPHGSPICNGGNCSYTCTAPFNDCDNNALNGCETDTSTAANNCGACGRVCTAPNATTNCTNSVCGIQSCQPGFGDCDKQYANGCEQNLSVVNNCGACGFSCPVPANATAGCTMGVCGVGQCSPGFADCDGQAVNGCEVNTQLNVNNCGKCGSVCPPVSHGNPACAAGNCGFTCVAPFNDCDGVAQNGCETDTSTNAQSCGGCGRICVAPNATTNCNNSVCGVAACNAGFGDCDKAYVNGCEVQLNSVTNCGGCGVTCPVLPNAAAGCNNGVCGIGSCAPGFADCDGQAVNGCEVNTQTTVNNCGKCGNTCPAVSHGNPACSAGNCGFTCVAPWNDCDGVAQNGCEADTSGSPTSCGGCGRVCAAANATTGCANSACNIASCNAGFGDCDKAYANGCEVSLATTLNCGACGNACAVPANSTATCTNGVCGIGMCNAGYSDCDNNPANGCEIATTTNANNCGKCGNVCPPVSHGSPLCTAGNCSFTCGAPWNDCDANPLNGCETDTSSSATHCGTCGKACTAPNAVTACANSVCAVASCNAGFGDCDKTYVNGCEVPLTTTLNCGACGNACPAPANSTATCANGVCGIGGCNAGFADCDGQGGNGCEVNTQTSASNCSRCGNVCPTPPHATPLCTNSACSFTCVGTWADCDGNAVNGCETDTSSTVSACGSCGKACNAANATTQCAVSACSISACNPGFADCDKVYTNGCEVSTNLDPSNCGACARACAPVNNGSAACVAGNCQVGSCSPGYADCDKDLTTGCEAQTATNLNNCGACGNICPTVGHSTRTCAAGLCGFSCDAGFADCDKAAVNGCETTLAVDVNNCGACNNICAAAPNGSPTCVASKCALLCNGTFRDCDGNLANGCETNSTADVNNCGACGKACPNPGNTIPNCANSICGFTCIQGFSDCDGNPANGCEVNLNTSQNCGGCGKVCPAFNNAVGACVAGQCSFTCNNGWGDCDGLAGNGCESNIATDANNCGRCTQVCSANNMSTRTCGAGSCNGNCNNGFADCNSNKLIDGCEINLLSDANNCGTCGIICSANNMATRTCGGGSCNGTCNTNFANCNGNLQSDGCEVNLLTDPNNCSNCGTICSGNNMATRTCGNGACNGACNGGFANCNGNLLTDGCEINLTNDPNNCGGCGSVCSSNNMATRTCGGSSCNGACAGGWGDCNGSKLTDGCETQLNSNSNCGGCGVVCSTPNATPTCGGGSCAIASCNANFFNVDGAVGNGCECSAASTNVCGGATSLGTIAWGASTTQTGTIPGTQAERWYVVAWGNSGASFHPHVTVSTTGGSAVVFDVYAGGCAGLTATGCAAEGGSSTSRTDWETNQTAGDPSTGSGTFTWTQPGNVGQLAPGTNIWIRVRGTNGGSCSTYSLVVKNG